MSKEKQIDTTTNTTTHNQFNNCELEQIGEMSALIHAGRSLQLSYVEIAEYLYKEGFRRMPDNIGEFSDGYHTFNELYHHRAVLFSVICNMFPEKAWKSKLHDTGDMYDGMFIVGIETEQGQATYHYDIEPYWDMFKVKELEKAPKYDGHTPSEAIARIGNLPSEGYRKQSEWISVEERLPTEDEYITHHNDGLDTLKRLTIAYMTDTIEYTIGCYDGYKWVNQLGNKIIKDVVAWKPFELYEAPKGGA